MCRVLAYAAAVGTSCEVQSVPWAATCSVTKVRSEQRIFRPDFSLKIQMRRPVLGRQIHRMSYPYLDQDSGRVLLSRPHSNVAGSSEASTQPFCARTPAHSSMVIGLLVEDPGQGVGKLASVALPVFGKIPRLAQGLQLRSNQRWILACPLTERLSTPPQQRLGRNGFARFGLVTMLLLTVHALSSINIGQSGYFGLYFGAVPKIDDQW